MLRDFGVTSFAVSLISCFSVLMYWRVSGVEFRLQYPSIHFNHRLSVCFGSRYTAIKFDLN
jgi:hypothetical protein